MTPHVIPFQAHPHMNTLSILPPTIKYLLEYHPKETNLAFVSYGLQAHPLALMVLNESVITAYFVEPWVFSIKAPACYLFLLCVLKNRIIQSRQG
jgi:hypothetical protein